MNLNPVTGELIPEQHVDDNHSGVNLIKEGEVLCVENNKEMKSSFITIEGILIIYGLVVIG